ncbi:PAS domain S-box protein, partial [bacterium]|nr:PAS domain S-box protein [bacterium]
LFRYLYHEIDGEGGPNKSPPPQLYELMRRQGGGSPQIGALFVTDKNGIMFNNTQEYPPRQINVSDREYFRHYLENPGTDLYLSKPVMSRLVKRWRFNLIRPLNPPDTAFAGLLAVAFDVDYFKKFFTASSIGPHGRIAIFRTDGAPLVCEPYVQNIYGANMRSSKLFRTRLPASPSGTYHTESSIIDKSPRIVAYKRLSRFPAVAVVSLSRDDILEPWTRKALLQGVVTLGLCLVIVSLARIMFRHLDKLKIVQTGLRSHQERLRIKAAQIDAANDAILQIDHEGRLLHFNQALCRMSGFSHDELTGRMLHDLEPPESVDHTKANLLLVTRDGEAMFDAAFLAKDGCSVPIEVHAHSMESDGGTFILCIARDVRERKRSEMREQARLRILEKLATRAPLATLLDQIVYFVEQQIPGAIGSLLLADEAGKRLLHGAAPSLPEEYNQAVHGLRIAQGMGSSGTAAHLRQPVIVDDITCHPFWKGFKPAQDAGLRSCWSQPVLSSEGELLGALAVYRREPHSPDDEERALLESAAHLASIAIGRVRQEEQREHLEGQLRHIQRIEAIGQLAGGIAHDFNNLLTPIFCYADMIKRNLPQEAPQYQMAESILQTAHKAKGLTQKLLSFGRRQRLNMQPLDLNETIQSFHDILQCTIRENIAIRMNLAPGPAPVMADRGQIEQMLLNLAVNAQDAIKGNGTITINTGHVLLDDEYVRLHPGMQPGPHILLTVADNGHGMDDETLSHIFEPFFTTKQVGHGTGLGLATVFGTVKQHEGYIAVESRAGEGTTFTIYLPAKAPAI